MPKFPKNLVQMSVRKRYDTSVIKTDFPQTIHSYMSITSCFLGSDLSQTTNTKSGDLSDYRTDFGPNTEDFVSLVVTGNPTYISSIEMFVQHISVLRDYTYFCISMKHTVLLLVDSLPIH